jgi:hypothetical protein
MHQRTKLAAVRILHHRHVARVAQRELPAGAAFGLGGDPRRLDDVGRHAGEIGLVRHVVRPRVLAIEHVVVEAGGERRELLLDRLESRLVRVGELGAA